MIFWINKFVGWMTNPFSLGLMMIASAVLLNFRPVEKKNGRLARFLLVFSLLWLWFWSTPLATLLIGVPLEREFLVNGKLAPLRSYPVCDAIVDLGGGVASHPQPVEGPNMLSAADRPFFAAALWKAGKGRIIIPTSKSVSQADVKILQALGVPSDRIVAEDQALNTEENARYTAKILGAKGAKRKKVLLVTSAWHMKRSLLQFKKYAPAIDVLPAPCDFEATGTCADMPLWRFIIPASIALEQNCRYCREWIGYFGYKFLRH